MTKFYPTAKTLTVSNNTVSLQKTAFYFFCVTVCVIASLMVNAQGITINKRSSLVMNGNVSLIVNNGAFNNNGNFTASTSTVKFSGNTDTVTAYVGGSKKTTFHNMSVTKAANGVALKSAVGVRNVLTVQGGNLYTDSNLTLISDAALTARVDEVAATSQIIGKTNVQRYFPARRAWRMITAPVTNATTIYNSWQNNGVYTSNIGMLVTGPTPTGANGNGLDVSPLNNVSLKTWNPAAQTFSNVTNTNVAISSPADRSAANKGYFAFVRGDRNPVNTTVTNTNETTITSIGSLQTGTQTFAAATKARAYTMIGNPYASPVDFNKVSRTNVVKRFYVWDPKLNVLGGYVMLDDINNDGIYTKSIAGSSQTKDLQSSQAFFIETKSTGAASITFNESSKSAGNNNMVFKPVTPNGKPGVGVGQIITSLNLLESDNSTILADGALVEFDTLYSAEVDEDDALKFGNINEGVAIVAGTSTLAAERRPALDLNDTVFLKLTKLVLRNYQFEFTAEGLQEPTIMGLLEDTYLKTTTVINLSGVTKVNFTVTADAASTAANRFRIVFKGSGTVLPVTISSVVAYQKNTNIAVDWKVENEINMVQYEVEKSTNGTSFAKVATIEVKGNNNAFNSYNWLDMNAAQGNNFYRIKTIDKSGKIVYSSIVKVAMGTKEAGFSIYPNPITTNTINLQINNQAAGTYKVVLTNTIGQVLYTNSIKNIGSSTHSLNTGAKLPAGIYNLAIIGQDNNINTQKVIVE